MFYNQDWYLQEKFMEKPLELNWFLFRKMVYDESRGKNPENIIEQFNFPSATISIFFFVCWFSLKNVYGKIFYMVQ